MIAENMKSNIIGIIEDYYSNNNIVVLYNNTGHKIKMGGLKLNNNEMYIPIKDTILKFDFETKTLLIKTNSKNYQCRIADFISTLIEMSE